MSSSFTLQWSKVPQINTVNYLTHSVWFFIGQIMQKKLMHHGEIANTVWLLKSLVCLGYFNRSKKLPNIIKLEWMIVHSKQTTVGDKINVRKIMV